VSLVFDLFVVCSERSCSSSDAVIASWIDFAISGAGFHRREDDRDRPNCSSNGALPVHLTTAVFRARETVCR
jgi:hypothetical protein